MTKHATRTLQLLAVMLAMILSQIADFIGNALDWPWLWYFVLAATTIPNLIWIVSVSYHDSIRRELISRARAEASSNEVHIMLSRVQESGQRHSYICALSTETSGLVQLKNSLPGRILPWNKVVNGGLEQSELGLGKQPVLYLVAAKKDTAQPARFEARAVYLDSIQNDPDSITESFAKACIEKIALRGQRSE